MQTDLDTDVEIIPDNIEAVGAIYHSYQLEQMGVFRVVERIVELYTQGLLPLGRGRAADALDRYARSGERLTAQERASFYSQALGAPGGTAGAGQPNPDFLSLWMRFVVAVSMLVRQQGAVNLLRPATPANANLRRASRALAANASAHGGGSVRHAACVSSEEVRQLVELLNEPELRQAFGARDMWQVIDQVNRNELDGARNVARCRTQAEAGSRVLQWLAAHAAQLSSAAQIGPQGSADDVDLALAVEEWLAASGMSDESVEQLSQPVESPTMIISPIDMPAIAQDLLAAIGLATAGGEATQALHGLVALFQGAAGTGKTLAAHVLAQALGRDILRIDLAQVVSKYIGETEKNLDALFDEAERTGAILFFDEADALFGGRTDVKDSHDRCSNVDVAYLLQRIVAHQGIVIVAIHRHEEIDESHFSDDWRRRHRRRVSFPRKRNDR